MAARTPRSQSRLALCRCTASSAKVAGRLQAGAQMTGAE
eukprot:CAMPEP_0170590344 /NCGR_PEP_ID=MMETSP0224-20130122/11821_1 /TAXON_ID=285029 /ORGANISM="Togula jolla, Strain CCCM 725" /LENGTH=38 /DNA_ID= /DNA_START= /DNA_END= /DNA_ORIENTATION=